MGGLLIAGSKHVHLGGRAIDAVQHPVAFEPALYYETVDERRRYLSGVAGSTGRLGLLVGTDDALHGEKPLLYS
ncbi:hypothetical protein [Phytohabitans houttuyneae]|uniref:hypothetical protein n=1 Tax=Phytohabitans houttuyneae TaxID=1076126 RepID=UPI001564421D|nr:hypothetical protein [Phytohabitans houttuyneae]